MKIADREISSVLPPYIVAEISGNHCGVIENAIRLIKAAKRAGADAVKTQCYDPESMTLDIKKPDFIVQSGLWKGRSLYELYNKAQTPPRWHKELYQAARGEGIAIFSSVFDKRGVDLLDALGCPAFKIASFEIVDIPLLQYAAQTHKPLIISTGMASDREILEANDAAGDDVAFLHCTSEYPALVSHAQLTRMSEINELLNHQRLIGLSDHTLGIEIPVAATAMGADIIEKHLKLERPDKSDDVSEDDSFSSTPDEFSAMVNSVKAVWAGIYDTKSDGEMRQLRRSIYVVKDIKKGEQFTNENIRVIRPGYGMAPKHYNNMLGKHAKRDWRRGDPLS